MSEPNFPPQVSKRMQHLKEDLFEKVSAVLKSPNDRPNGQAALRAALAGRWQAALDKAARFWARHRDSSNAARAEMEAPLQELHEYIHATIDAEVSPLIPPPSKKCFEGCIACQGYHCCHRVAVKVTLGETSESCTIDSLLLLM